MSLEEKLQAPVEAYGQRQPDWEKKQRHWKPWVRLVLRASYFMRGYGPGKIEGPALVVFDKHDYSPDPIFIVRQDGFLTMVAKEDTALLTRVAKKFGGIIVDEAKTKVMLARLKEQLYFHLDHGHVIGVFPYNDVNEDVISLGVVRTVMRWESDNGVRVNYVPAAVRYTNTLPFVEEVWRMPRKLHNWPVPWLTQARILVSNSSFSSEGLFPNSAGAQKLVQKLMAESELLPIKYLRNL